MNFLKSLLITAFLFTSVQAFAHHEDKDGPCKDYWATCKDTKGGKKAKWKCVKDAAAADTANGAACTASMDHKKGKMMKHRSEGGAPTESAPASN